MRIVVATASVALLTALASPLAAQTVQPRIYDVQQSESAPQIDLWLDQVSYRRGDRITPYFVTDPGAFVTIVRVTSDGALTVLYPRRPMDQVRFQKSQLASNRVPFSSFDGRFSVNDESDGIGFVFAIASFDRFDFSYYTNAGMWSYARLYNDGRYGDPFEIVRRFVDRTLGQDADFSLDYVSYDVNNPGVRTRYASRYGYNTYDGYYDDCVSAFGLRYTSYCQAAYPGLYGRAIVGRPPRTPTPNVPSGPNYAGKHIRPVTGDPMAHGAPQEPEVTTEGRLPPSNASEEAALAARRDRLSRQVAPRDRSGSTVDTRPVDNTPRVYTAPARSEPVQRAMPDRQPVMRAEPRVEQQRAEPRPQSAPQPRVEVRNDPPRAQQVQRSEPAPRPTATPAEKDHDQRS